ncbi:MAG TPA: hypothetical protein VJN69_09405 [Candidatus Acidoferrales bacterium]|nr:hypothetical protein [Candidatus Acidoferrales bacterium]
MKFPGPFFSTHCMPGEETSFHLLPNSLNSKFHDVVGSANEASLYGPLDYPFLLRLELDRHGSPL